MLAQEPDVCLVAGKACAVDSRLLSRADADGLSVLCVAHGVRLCVFERDKRQDEVALCVFGQCFVLRRDVLHEHGLIDFQLVAALLECYSKHIFIFLFGGLVALVDFYDVVGALPLGFKYLERLVGVTRRDNAVGNLTLDKPCRLHVANV